MSEPASRPRRPWLAPILRAIPALIVGLVITFSADHSTALGLTMLAGFGLTTAAVLWGSGRLVHAQDPLNALHRGLAVVAAVVGILAAAAALLAGASLPLLLLLIAGYAVLAGALELVWGIRFRDRSPLARDGIIVGVGTLVLAVILALVADPVSAVGFLGAYAVVLGVFLVIAGLSARWSTSATEGGAV